jgi:hypothetical protein
VPNEPEKFETNQSKMTFPPDDRWFRQYIEMQKQLEKYYKPFNDILREQQSALDYLKDLELTHYEEMFHAPHLA